ncbi:MAG: hypothetical protein KAS53_03330 [Candidatus Cloacimonetes bacterium]|nr:hypothetical protein [Candidatus Cloacimonadota bacterium]
MKFVYTSSTYPIFLGLYLQLKGERIHFLYTRKNYVDFFERLNVDATYIEIPSHWDLVLKPQKIKNKIKKINELIGKDDLAFTHLQFAQWLFIILSNRLEDSKSYFYDFEPPTRNQIFLIDIINSLKKYILILLLKFTMKIWYKTYTVLSYYARKFFLSLDQRRFSQYNIIKQHLDFSFENMQKLVIESNQIEHDLIKNIYIGQNEVIMKNTVYKSNSIDRIHNFITDNNISVKPHPTGYPYPKSENIISPHIPTEFLFSKITNSIISINSTTLIAASKFYRSNSNVKIICLMKLVNYLDKESENEMIKRIRDRSENNILYPETFEELEELL